MKLKVANRAWSEDRIRIQTLVDALRAGVQVRLDANGGWTEEQARQAMGELSDWPLELIEQPVAPDDLEAMARLREIAGADSMGACAKIRDALLGYAARIDAAAAALPETLPMAA